MKARARNRYYLVEDEAGAVIDTNKASNVVRLIQGWLYYVVKWHTAECSSVSYF